MAFAIACDRKVRGRWEQRLVVPVKTFKKEGFNDDQPDVDKIRIWYLEQTVSWDTKGVCFLLFWFCYGMDKRIEMNQETEMKQRHTSATTDTAPVKESWVSVSPLISSLSLHRIIRI